MFENRKYYRERRGESAFQKGDLKYVILDLIRDKPRYGYEIIRALEERSFGFYSPSPGVVYPTLQMLEEMGYASAVEQDGKKVYTITEEGRRFLTERKGVADEIRSHMRRRWDPENIAEMGEIVGELGRLGKVMRRRLRNIDADKLRRVREVVARASQQIEAILEE